MGNRYLYTGREWEPESGLYYYRARHYDPTIGRFLQPDPIGYADGLNMYQYVGGNPVIFVDPTGLILWGQVAKGAGKIVGGGILAVAGAVVAGGTSVTGIGIAVGTAGAVSGSITLGTGFSDIVSGLVDVDTSYVPSDLGDIVGAAITQTTGSETAGDVVDTAIDQVSGKPKLNNALDDVRDAAEKVPDFVDLLLEKGKDNTNKEDGDGSGDNNLHDVFIMSDSGGGKALARGLQPFRSPFFLK